MPTIFDKEAKTIQWSKDSLSTNGTETTEYPHEKKKIYIQTLYPSQKLSQNGS